MTGRKATTIHTHFMKEALFPLFGLVLLDVYQGVVYPFCCWMFFIVSQSFIKFFWLCAGAKLEGGIGGCDTP
jgi:hypothetical protein